MLPTGSVPGPQPSRPTAPFTLFVAADGTIVRQTGVLEEAELRAYVEELVA